MFNIRKRRMAAAAAALTASVSLPYRLSRSTLSPVLAHWPRNWRNASEESRAPGQAEKAAWLLDPRILEIIRRVDDPGPISRKIRAPSA